MSRSLAASPDRHYSSTHFIWVLLPTTVIIAATLLTTTFSDLNIFRSGEYYQRQTELFLQINHTLGARAWFWTNVTELGDALICLPLLSFLAVKMPSTWAALFGAIPLSGLFSSVGKQMAGVPRPAAIFPHDQIFIIGDTLTSDNSLPSGHSITVFAVMTVFLLSAKMPSSPVRRSLWVISIYLLASLIAISRVVVGAHWPLDVVAGACLGIAGGLSGIWLTQQFSVWWTWVERSKGKMISGLVLMLWSFFLVYEYWHDADVGLITPWLAAICALTTGFYLFTMHIMAQGRALDRQDRDATKPVSGAN